MSLPTKSNNTAINNKQRYAQLLIGFSMLSAVCYYLIVLFLSEVPHDDGDGLAHFSIAQESWVESEYFLNHWGKPLFTLFSSPFAQLGFNGYISFNILVFGLSCLIIWKILHHYSTPTILIALFPWILISISDYTFSIIGGMTEPFFGLLLLLLFLTALKEKWLWFALITSFMPFARSEGMLIVIAAVPYLLLFKQWKFIPVLGIGFGLYALVGWGILDQPLWYFENNPYTPLSIYGSGPWYEYILSARYHLGPILIWSVPFALFGIWVWKQYWKRSDLIHVLFFTGIYIFIVAIHSYLWANGLRGSMGLSRLAILGLLPFMVIEIIALGFVFKELHVLTHAFFALFIAFLVQGHITYLNLPTKANSQQIALREASQYIEKNKAHVGKIYYFHPLIVYYLGLNIKHKSVKYKQHYVKLGNYESNNFKTGDILIRDPKFGPLEQGLDFEELKQYPWIVPVKQFYTTTYYEPGTQPESVVIYQVMNRKSFHQEDWNNKIYQTRKTRGKSISTPRAITDESFNLDNEFFIPPLNGPRQELFIEVELKKPGEKPVYLVFSDKNGYYVSVQLFESMKKVIIPFVTGKTTGSLSIHNPNFESYELKIKPTHWSQTVDIGIQKIN